MFLGHYPKFHQYGEHHGTIQSNPIQSNPIQSKLKLLGILTASALLAACGSSGSSSSAPTPNKPHHSSNSNTGNSGNNASANTGGSNHSGNSGGAANANHLVKIEGNYLRIPYEIKDVSDIVNNLTTGNITVNGDLDSLRVDGQNISLQLLHQKNDTFINIKDDYHKVLIGRHLQHARYGWIAKTPAFNTGIPSSQRKQYYFAHGTPSATLDTGKLDYIGHAIYDSPETQKTIPATSRFEVDFDAKKLSGTVTAGTHSAQLSAGIEPNGRFSGTDKSGFITKGAFYGDKAAEMAGTFHHPTDAKGGAFGASKQPKQ